MKKIAFDILLLIGGIFLAGIRNIIGRWLVTTTLNVFSKLITNADHYIAVWLHKQLHKAHRVPQDCIKGKCADI